PVVPTGDPDRDTNRVLNILGKCDSGVAREIQVLMRKKSFSRQPFGIEVEGERIQLVSIPR
ncbi:MAG: hypothetical protein CEN91_287, partial [Candidatus Berkelbacteria bacterium Licking1014_85]